MKGSDNLCLHLDVKPFLDEKQIETLEEAVRSADGYSLTHRVSFISKPKSNFSHTNSKVNLNASSSPQNQSGTPKQKSFNDVKGQHPLSHLTCNYCKKPGHLISDC